MRLSITSIFLLALALCGTKEVCAQCSTPPSLFFQNPSLEGTPAQNHVPTSWDSCMFGNTPDIQPGIFGVNLPPANGSSYVGLTNDTTQIPLWAEGIAQQLSSPMLSGVTYTFTVDLANSSSTGGGINPGCAECQVWGGFQPCDDNSNTGVLLWHSGNITPFDAWQLYTVTFTPAQNFTWVMFRVKALGCSSEPYILIDNIGTITPSPVVANIEINKNVTCAGQSNGIATVQATGANAPFTYAWSSPNVINDTVLFDVPAGTYTVTVTDDSLCTATATVTITEPAPLVLSTTPTNLNCFGDNTGGASVNFTGGSAPMVFNWSNGSVLQSLTGLSAATYAVTVTDDSLCTATASVNLTQPSQINIAGNVTTVACNGGANGAIALNVTGGSAGYTYSWNTNPVQTTANAINLTAGSYTATVTDANSCTASASFNVSQVAGSLSVSLLPTNVLCFGQSTGSIAATVSGGSPAYTYAWNTIPIQTTPTALNLVAGNFTVTVTDANSCSATANSIITQPASALTATISETDILCSGLSTGSVTAIASGGVGGYTYAWSTFPVQNIATVLNLLAGSYTVTITDANNCTYVGNTTIGEPTAISLSETQTNVLCFGDSSGSAGVIVSGGNAPYSYSWSTNPVQTNATAVNLMAGSYSVIVNDASGCSVISSFNISQPAAGLALSLATTNPTCFAINTGSINALVSGGTAAYNYTWSTNPVQTTASVSNLNPGTYTITVTDAGNCSVSASATILQSPPALTAAINTNNVLCYGLSTGSATVTVGGGNSPYLYTWNTTPVQTTATASGLSAGNYVVTITDAGGCTLTAGAGISQPANPVTLTQSQVNVLCYGDSNGTATITATGGTGPYNFSWNTNPLQTGATAVNLPAGNYSVMVSDSNSCTALVTYNILQPAVLQANINVANVLCYGQFTGSTTATVSGGTGVYNYSWSTIPVQTSPIATGLSAGYYTLTVSDANACTATAIASVNQPISGLVGSPTQVNVLCFGFSTGSATFNVLGGTPGYNYQWNTNPVQTTPTAANLAAGTYSVTVSDQNNCSVGTTVTITQPPQPLQLAITHTDVQCYGARNGSATAIVTGGVPAYAYSWSTLPVQKFPNAINLNPGLYIVTVTDLNNCSITGSAIISQPPSPITLSTSQTDVSCFKGSNGTAVVLATGGVPGYTYIWNTAPAQITDTAINLAANSYLVTVTDANLCTATASVIITQPLTQLTVTTNLTAPHCFSDSAASVIATALGGGGNYLYAWNTNPIQTTAGISNVSPGSYTVVITDGYGCSTSGSVIVPVPPTQLIVTTTHTNILCYNQPTGSITVSASGSWGTYSYTWNTNPAQNTATAINLPAGNYTVTVTDSSGCSATAADIVTQPASPITLAIAGSNLLCYGNSNGTVSVTATGGTPGYSYLWNSNPPQSLNTATALSAGSYQVSVTDANGCTQLAETNITQPAALIANAALHNISCFASGDGQIGISVSGGVPAYSYQWNIGAVGNNPNAANLQAGNYTVLVTDANNCPVLVDNLIITQPAALALSTTISPESCPGNNDGAIISAASGGTLPFTYAWSNGNSEAAIGNLSNGVYSLTVTDINGCTIDATNLIVPTLTGITMQGTATNMLCEPLRDGSVVVTANSNFQPLEYLWSTGATSSSITALDTGTYAVTVTDAHGCRVDSSFHIGNDAIWSIQTTPDTATIYLGQSVNINVTASGPYGSLNWGPIEGLNCTDCPNPVAAPIQSTTYKVTATDEHGCVAIDYVQITVIPDYVIFIPNVFSPNGDGNNDYFEVFGKKESWKQFSVSIFDRWGEKVYESEDMDFKWDGTYRGKLLNPTVLAYEVSLVYMDNHTDKLYKGSVTLVR